MKCPFCPEHVYDDQPQVMVQGVKAHQRCYEAANQERQRGSREFRERVPFEAKPGTKPLKERELRE